MLLAGVMVADPGRRETQMVTVGLEGVAYVRRRMAGEGMVPRQIARVDPQRDADHLGERQVGRGSHN